MKKFFFGVVFLANLLVVVFYATNKEKFLEYINKEKEVLKSKVVVKQYQINRQFFMFQTYADANYANFLHTQRRTGDFRKFIANLYKNKAFYLLPVGSSFYIIKQAKEFYNINVTFKDEKHAKGWVPILRINDYIDGRIDVEKRNNKGNKGSLPKSGTPPQHGDTMPVIKHSKKDESPVGSDVGRGST